MTGASALRDSSGRSASTDDAPSAGSPAAGSSRALISNFVSLVGTTGVTAAFGVVFWWVAAHYYSPSDVGIATAAVSAMALLGAVATLGFPTLLISELGRDPAQTRSLLGFVLMLTALAGVALGAAYGAIAPLIGLDTGFESAAGIALFAAGVALTSSTIVLDLAVIGLHRGGLQFWRNVVFATVKLVAIAVVGYAFSAPGSASIYAVWVGGALVSLVVFTKFAREELRLERAPVSHTVERVKGLWRPAAAHHVLNLALKVPGLALPIVVLGLLSAATNAAFFMAWMIIMNFVLIVPQHLTTALFATGVADPGGLAWHTRRSVRASLIGGTVAATVIILAAEPLLKVFGDSYAADATTALRILSLGVLPFIVRSHFIALSRANDRVARDLPVVLIGTLAELILPIVGAMIGGLNGLSVGWVCAITLEAAVMGPTLIRGMQPADSTEPGVGSGDVGGPAPTRARPT